MSRQGTPGAFRDIAYDAGIMIAGTIVSALRRERAALALRWLGRFTVSRAAAGHPAVAVGDAVVLALFDDMVSFLDPGEAPAWSGWKDGPAALAHLAEFPECIAVTIDLLQAGVQVIGAFAVEQAGPRAAWSLRDRNRFLGELDAVFPLLVRREVMALCERHLPGDAQHSAETARAMIGRSRWARASVRRN